MAIILTDGETELLKELKGAGDRGRLNARWLQPDMLTRLVKAKYVRSKSVSEKSVVYYITPWGRRALEHSLEGKEEAPV